MARKSRFTIYEDTGIPTPDNSFEDPFDDTLVGTKEQEADECLNISEEEDIEEELDVPPIEHDVDDERRVSAVTTASVSTYPDSLDDVYQSQSNEPPKPYTPPLIRPSFRRPQSVQRMRMTSPFGERSPRQSILRHPRSRTGTPKSVLSASGRGSPRRRRQVQEEEEEQEAEEKHHPLVLLHVTLLPINLPWSMESMQELLPIRVLENLQLLRSKVSDTVLQRGVLIPHPREEYELLEERLLEALELKETRVTKCGHWRVRDSAGSDTVESDSDSGLGSSLDGSEGEPCTTCQHHIKSSKSAVGTGSRKWTIKVYAANGLMRMSAWSAAWSEMEGVDVEILPWISDAMRRQLDERREQEEVEEQDRMEDEESRVKALVEEQVRLAHAERKRVDELERRLRDDEVTLRQTAARQAVDASHPQKPFVQNEASSASSPSPPEALPQIYRPSQVPLSVLLKNYVYLLAKDRKNMLLLVLGMIALFFAINPTIARTGLALDKPGAPTSSPTALSAMLPSAMMDLPGATSSVMSSVTPDGIETVIPEMIPTGKDELAFELRAETMLTRDELSEQSRADAPGGGQDMVELGFEEQSASGLVEEIFDMAEE